MNWTIPTQSQKRGCGVRGKHDWPSEVLGTVWFYPGFPFGSKQQMTRIILKPLPLGPEAQF